MQSGMRNIMGLSNIVVKFLHKGRFFLLQHFNRNVNVVVDGTPNIHKNADVEVGKYSMLKIGYGFTMRKNSIIAVRDNAQLRIGCKVFINRNVIIMARRNITIGNGVTIGPNVCIYDHDHDIKNKGGYVLSDVKINDNTWTGSNVTILKGVTIGEHCVIGSGAIVTKDVPANTVLIQKRINTKYSL